MTLLTNAYGQSKEEKEVIEEGTKLYKSEMASWYGTDLLLEKFADKQKSVRGYLSYPIDDKAVCIFFSNAESPKILATFTFDNTYNTQTALTDGQEREPTKQESDLITIRQKLFRHI